MVADDPSAGGTNPPARRTRSRAPRCQTCVRQHQKCIFSRQPGTCDRCLERDVDCIIARAVPKKKKARTRKRSVFTEWSRFKCSQCRNVHSKCDPEYRAWPAKCHRCERKGLPCGPAITADGEEFQDEAPAPKRHRSRSPLVRSDVLPALEPPLTRRETGQSVFAPQSAASWSSTDSDSDSDASIPAAQQPREPSGSAPAQRLPAAGKSALAQRQPVLPPPKAKTLPSLGRANGEGGGAAAAVASSDETIRRMEEEFQEVIRQLQDNHHRELEAQREGYEREMDALRERYERRLDDLIQIMKSMGQSR